MLQELELCEMLLTSFLLVLSNLIFTFAQQPDFYFPPGTSVLQKQRVYQAFRDAITLARVVATTGDPCDQVRPDKRQY